MIIAAFDPPAVTTADLSTLSLALAEWDQPSATLQALDRLLDRLVGHKLFTALVYRTQAGVAERVYSSRPDIYPAHGTKALEDAPAMQGVLASGRPYLGRDKADVVRDFPDADKIFALNCGSVLNVPIRWQGSVIGQINLLHEAGHYKEHHVNLVEPLAQIVVPAFLPAVKESQ